MEQHGTVDRGDGVRLAYAHLPGLGPTVVFLPGYGSDMAGAKALALQGWCAAHGQALLRLDYSGHGASGGAFADGTIGRWTDDAAAVVERLFPAGPMILVGSSMGGWIALLLALRLGERVAGVVGVAAAPDFTERLMWDAMASSERAALLRDGFLDVPSAYGPTQQVTRALIEDGRRHLLLGGRIALRVPVRLLQGQADPDVPWETALALAAAIEGADIRIVLVKDGDHRLSRPADLALLTGLVGGLLGVGAFSGEDGGEALAERGIAPMMG